MIIVGCDFHPSFQQIAMLDTETGATEEHKLVHMSGEAESFYRKLASPAIVGRQRQRQGQRHGTARHGKCKCKCKYNGALCSGLEGAIGR